MTVSEHAEKIAIALANPGTPSAAFVAFDETSVLGFAEISLRSDHVNGCDTTPVAFLEGVYVRPEAERWALVGGFARRWRHGFVTRAVGSLGPIRSWRTPPDKRSMLLKALKNGNV